MANVVIAGMQWGDEGKGKIVDLICPAFDLVARYQGGHNAGHTVKFADRHFSLHLIPSGILHEGMDCVLGNGMVIAPDALFRELEGLAGAGVDTDGRLHISHRAHVILPWHVELDQAREEARGKHAIGTTARGIGPAYEGKVSRNGLRVCDLLSAAAGERLDALHGQVRAELSGLGAAPPTPVEEVRELCQRWGERLRPYLADTQLLLIEAIAEGKPLLFEGAQGALLDVDHGTYPYVTSSSSTAGGVCTGTGVPPSRIDGVLGVLKAYTTRVGGGPFPGELVDEAGEWLRRRGNEFGTTTGRPRRCGWLDLVAARYACRLNGVDTIALTKLDVLDTLDEIPVATAYRVDGEMVTELPADPRAFADAEPVYETLPGWKSDTSGVLEFDRLPPRARDYVRFVEDQVGAPCGLISSGPRREETILRSGGAFEELVGDRLDRVLAERGA